MLCLVSFRWSMANGEQLWTCDGWLFHIILLIMYIDSPGGCCLVYSLPVMHLCPLLHWWMYPNLNLCTATSIWLMQDTWINHLGPALSVASHLSLSARFLFSLVSILFVFSFLTKLNYFSHKLWLCSFDFACSWSSLLEFIIAIFSILIQSNSLQV